MNSLEKHIKEVALIKIHGKELSKRYSDAKGPGNIDKNDMWKIHTEYSDQYLSTIMKTATDESMITTRFATSCYPEHGVPLILYFLYKNSFEFTFSLLDNANAGGDNVHRGMILGLLAGATTNTIPSELQTSLIEYEDIKKEIDDFVDVITDS
jgi:ADP-ribosylglycohydrolase